MRTIRVFVTSAAAFVAFAALSACDAGGKNADVSSHGPQLHISSPRMDHVFADPEKAEVLFDLRDYEIGKVEDGKSGQHVHLIVDDMPYEAIYDVGKPIPLRDFAKKQPGQIVAPPLSEGTHVIRAFPSAGPKDKRGMLHHESWKNPGAFVWLRFHVVKKGGDLEGFDASKPTLTYSRPKGEYKVGSPELDRFLIDFYITGTRLQKGGHAVRATLDGRQLTLEQPKKDKDGKDIVKDGKPEMERVPALYTTWQRETIASPAVGEHELLLELVDRDDKLVEGPFNSTTRKFKVVP
jgi:hypothetical protein